MSTRNHSHTIIILLLSVLPGLSLASDCVILLHGLARSDASMAELDEKLGKEGYHVVNVDYPSRKHTVEELAASVIPAALERCEEQVPINFVTHSLGGIILRQYLQEAEIKRLKRVVMLGPPNKGSEVVDAFRKVPGFRWINGPAGLQLGTEEGSIPRSLGAADFELGIIAGSRTINLVLSQALPNPDDGKVSVENTKLEGMKDHITLPVSHPFLMKDDDAIEQVLRFLEVGEFDHARLAQ